MSKKNKGNRSMQKRHTSDKLGYDLNKHANLYDYFLSILDRKVKFDPAGITINNAKFDLGEDAGQSAFSNFVEAYGKANKTTQLALSRNAKLEIAYSDKPYGTALNITLNFVDYLETLLSVASNEEIMTAINDILHIRHGLFPSFPEPTDNSNASHAELKPAEVKTETEMPESTVTDNFNMDNTEQDKTPYEFSNQPTETEDPEEEMGETAVDANESSATDYPVNQQPYVNSSTATNINGQEMSESVDTENPLMTDEQTAEANELPSSIDSSDEFFNSLNMEESDSPKAEPASDVNEDEIAKNNAAVVDSVRQNSAGDIIDDSPVSDSVSQSIKAAVKNSVNQMNDYNDDTNDDNSDSLFNDFFKTQDEAMAKSLAKM